MGSASVSEPMAPTLLRGLTILGPGASPDPDLALEFGMSAWMFRTNTDLFAALGLLASLRVAVLEAAGMDPRREPIPFVGRSPRDDVLGSVAYLGELLERAARVAKCTRSELAERAIIRLAELAPHLAVAVPVETEAPLAPIIPLRASLS
jgi:hypothetical protein